MAQIRATAIATGREQWIPEHWLDRFGDQFERAEKPIRVELPDGPPSLDWKADQLRAHADAKSIDLTGLRSKTDMLTAIEAGMRNNGSGSTAAAAN